MEKRSTKVTVRDEKEEEEEETLKTIPVTHVFRLFFAPAHVHNFHDQTHTHTEGQIRHGFFSLLLFFFYLCLLFFALSLSLVCALWCCCCCCCYRLEYPPSFSVHTSSTTTADDYWFTDALESSEHLHTNSHLHAHFSARTHTHIRSLVLLSYRIIKISSPSAHDPFVPVSERTDPCQIDGHWSLSVPVLFRLHSPLHTHTHSHAQTHKLFAVPALVVLGLLLITGVPFCDVSGGVVLAVRDSRCYGLRPARRLVAVPATAFLAPLAGTFP